jgi:hypothetical protein
MRIVSNGPCTMRRFTGLFRDSPTVRLLAFRAKITAIMPKAFYELFLSLFLISLNTSSFDKDLPLYFFDLRVPYFTEQSKTEITAR